MDTIDFEHGEPSWADQTSGDAVAAAAFYRELWGWDVPPGTEDFGGYSTATLNGQNVAGISPQQGPGGPYWSTYINVDDAKAVAALATANGGQVMVEPMEIGTFGTMAIFVDPTGAVIGAWQPNEHKGFGVRKTPGSVVWNELVTTDVAAASAFYSAVFGWTATSHGPADGPGGYSEFKLGDKTIGGMRAKGPMMPAEVPSHWAVYFAVDDTDAAAARITELGGKVMAGPMDIPPGRFAAVADSTGANFNILKSAR